MTTKQIKDQERNQRAYEKQVKQQQWALAEAIEIALDASELDKANKLYVVANLVRTMAHDATPMYPTAKQPDASKEVAQ